jgi:hypothetical protein
VIARSIRHAIARNEEDGSASSSVTAEDVHAIAAGVLLDFR